MTKSAGIVGAGLVGRILALELHRRGWDVTIFDCDSTGEKNCGFTAAGMLSLYSEADVIGDAVVQLGARSMELWPGIVEELGITESFCAAGSVAVAHANDLPDLERMCFVIRRRFSEIFGDLYITDRVCDIEPVLSSLYWMYIKGEAHIDNVCLFHRLQTLLRQRVVWRCDASVTAITCGTVTLLDGKSHTFDMAFDCRGIGAKHDIPQLRGVRGEVVLLHAPEVTIGRPVRMIHPRYSIYVVPRPQHVFVVGATEIESCDSTAISVQSMLELLSAAYSIHRGFAEARVINTMTACRPAFIDNHPRVILEDRVIRINGLYRYGYLVTPSIVEDLMLYLHHDKVKHPTIYVER